MRRLAAWLAAALAAASAGAALLPWPLPLVDALVALVPVVPPIAVAAMLVGGRRWSTALGGVALIVAVVLIAREAAAGDRGEASAGQNRTPTMTVVTHNVARANKDPRGTIAELAASGADVLLLQETDGTIAPYLAGLRHAYPYANACLRGCSMAIFSRWSLTRVRWRFHDAGGQAYGPALYTGAVRLPWGGSATLATLHLSRGGPAAARDARRTALVAAIRRAGAESMVLGGDLNLTPWGGAMRDFDAGLSPLRRATRAAFSFPARWDGQAVPLPLLPIDHLYAGPDWTVSSVQRLGRTGSDHYPIRIKLLWRRRGL